MQKLGFSEILAFELTKQQAIYSWWPRKQTSSRHRLNVAGQTNQPAKEMLQVPLFGLTQPVKARRASAAPPGPQGGVRDCLWSDA